MQRKTGRERERRERDERPKSPNSISGKVPRFSDRLSSLVAQSRQTTLENIWGYPLWGKSQKASTACVKERVTNTIQGWKNVHLTPAGREILIKPVITAIPAYPYGSLYDSLAQLG
ncbi:PREDICTED: uncharacterized protein LOC101301866 [Fragaria vesca subsp. vesca]